MWGKQTLHSLKIKSLQKLCPNNNCVNLMFDTFHYKIVGHLNVKIKKIYAVWDFGLTETLMCFILLSFVYYWGYKSKYNLGEQQAIAEFMATWGLDGGGDFVEVVHMDEGEELMDYKILMETLNLISEVKHVFNWDMICVLEKNICETFFISKFQFKFDTV